MIWDGTSEAESYQGTSQSDVLRGKAGNDTLTGGLGQDVFVLEATLAANGVDEIVDFQVKNRCSTGDILDLSAVFGSKLNGKNLNQYVRIAGNKLQLDIDGSSGPSQWADWAILYGVKEGDNVTIRSRRFTGVIKAGKEDGDSTAPSFDPNANYNFDYDENQKIDALVATVTGASDAKGVTKYRFSSPPAPPTISVSSAPTTLGTTPVRETSSDGYFEIDASGNIYMTEAGWKATVNDYDDTNISFDYYIQAGDEAGNWSAAQKINLKIKDLVAGGGSTIYLSLDRTGVWFDTDKDGRRDAGETAATLSAAGTTLKRVDNVDMEKDDVTLRIVDFRVATQLDLKGFGSGDKLIYDYDTNKEDWYGFSSVYIWKLSEKPVFDPNFLKNKVFDALNPSSFGGYILYSGARYNLTPAQNIGKYVDYTQYAGVKATGTRVNGRFYAYFGANPYTVFTGRASVTPLLAGWKPGGLERSKDKHFQ